MSLSQLPLSYCTNVHPGITAAAVAEGLRRYTAPIQQRWGQPLAAGLWLAEPVIRELRSRGMSGARALAHELKALDLVCYTLNAFPFGNFHSERVKEQVYLPDWTTDERLDYTVDCARVLAGLLPEGVEGSLSTVPLGYKTLAAQRGAPVEYLTECIESLIDCARALEDLDLSTGRHVRLAIEPEPLCVLETTAEAIRFFETMWSIAARHGDEELVRRHIGLCYDVCHQSVEFEDVTASIQAIDAAGVRINKVHITCAIEAPSPGTRSDVREALRRFIEPRYMHQTLACAGERTVSWGDLSEELLNCLHENALQNAFAAAECWRVHFHVPVDCETLGPLRTTRDDLKAALKAVHQLPYAPHLEVETYTWSVLPGEDRPDLVTGMTRELQATTELLETIAQEPRR